MCLKFLHLLQDHATYLDKAHQSVKQLFNKNSKRDLLKIFWDYEFISKVTNIRIVCPTFFWYQISDMYPQVCSQCHRESVFCFVPLDLSTWPGKSHLYKNLGKGRKISKDKHPVASGTTATTQECYVFYVNLKMALSKGRWATLETPQVG